MDYRVSAGPNEDVQTKLVLHFESLVQSLARKFSRGQGHDDDLYQVGMIGLLAASDVMMHRLTGLLNRLLCQPSSVRLSGLFAIRHGVCMCQDGSKN